MDIKITLILHEKERRKKCTELVENIYNHILDLELISKIHNLKQLHRQEAVHSRKG